MIKSDKEKKHYSNLLKPPINCHPYLRMSFQGWQLCLKEKNTPLEEFEPQSKVKLQVICGLDLDHFHVTWTTFKVNRKQLGTVSAYVM